MPSSGASSSSSVEIIDAKNGSDTDDADGDTDATQPLPVADRLTSSYQSQEALDALCRKHGVPAEFAARPAGDGRACRAPPPGAVCVYANALESGMRVPLHPFFSGVLTHFGIAPSQLMPNGWRVMAGFVVLAHFAGVPPSLAVFRHFFLLSTSKYKGWFCFRSKDAVGMLFTGLPTSHKGWKQWFFFLSSPAPWPCPVEWGEPSKTSMAEPVLTGEEKKWAAKLLRAHGATAVDLRTYLSDSNLAAAMITNRSSSPAPPAQPSPRTPQPFPHTTAATSTKGLDPSLYDMMKTMRAEKAAAAAAATVKAEPDNGTPGWPPLSGKKRTMDDANTKEEEAGFGGSMSGLSSPPGFEKPPESGQDRKPRHAVPDGHDGDTADWVAARALLQGIVTPSRERSFPAATPSDVVASSYISMLQAANYASFSFGHALELEEKLRAREREAAELREELTKAEAELAGARAAAVQEYLGSVEHVRRLAEHALAGYESGMADMKRVALRRYPHLDAAQLVVPLGGPPP